MFWFSNFLTSEGGWDAERVAAVVTADDAFADAPGKNFLDLFLLTLIR